jgi:microcompartment protein CcmL/EutN
MIDFALGLIETKGLIGAIEAADTMVKTSNVKLLGKECTNPAMITIKIIGDTAAVRSAVEAGAAAAQRVGQLISKHVIPRPAEGMEAILFEKTFLSDEEVAHLLGDVIHKEEIAPAVPESETSFEEEIIETVSTIEVPESDDQKTYHAQLEEMTVHKLRNFARGIQGLSIFGRQISKANKEELIRELLKAKFGI